MGGWKGLAYLIFVNVAEAKTIGDGPITAFWATYVTLTLTYLDNCSSIKGAWGHKKTDPMSFWFLLSNTVPQVLGASRITLQLVAVIVEKAVGCIHICDGLSFIHSFICSSIYHMLQFHHFTSTKNKIAQLVEFCTGIADSWIGILFELGFFPFLHT